MNKKHKGFTLIELLIVIVVLGVLSTMMVLSSTEAVSSARASNIVSNLRNFKTAAMAMYVDYYDKMSDGKEPDDTDKGSNKLLVKYINKAGSDSSKTIDTDTSQYTLEPKGGAWYVKLSGISDERIQQKLAGRAESVGLLAEANRTGNYTTGTYVYMFVTEYNVKSETKTD